MSLERLMDLFGGVEVEVGYRYEWRRCIRVGARHPFFHLAVHQAHWAQQTLDQSQVSGRPVPVVEFLAFLLGYKTETLIMFPAPDSLGNFGSGCAVIRRYAQCTRHVGCWQYGVDGPFGWASDTSNRRVTVLHRRWPFSIGKSLGQV